jgi:hypothetical protein
MWERRGDVRRWSRHIDGVGPKMAPGLCSSHLASVSASSSPSSRLLLSILVSVYRSHLSRSPFLHPSLILKGATMTRSQSLLTPEPTHIVRQPVTISHVCVFPLCPDSRSSSSHPSLPGNSGISSYVPTSVASSTTSRTGV